jgi:hypothetical protein
MEKTMNLHIDGVPFNDVLAFPFRGAKAFQRYLLIAGLTLACFIIPILPGLFVSGYSIRILRRARQEGKVEMPEWSDESRLLVDGVYSTLISWAYLLPGLLTLLGGVFLYFVSFFFIIPISDQSESFSIFAMFIPMIILFGGIAVGTVLLFLGVIPLPLALCRYADEGRLGAAFQIGEIFRALKKNLIGYFGAFVVCSGIFYILYFIYMIAYFTIILCCPAYLLMLAATPAAGCIYLAMIGLAYRQGKTAGQTDAVMKTASV